MKKRFVDLARLAYLGIVAALATKAPTLCVSPNHLFPAKSDGTLL